MRIARYHSYGGPEVLRVEEIDVPTPGADEVLVRIEAAGVNFAEVQRRQGIPIGRPSPLPAAPGGDVVGTVVSLGAGVTKVSVGDRVAAHVSHGAYADFAVAESAWVQPLPADADAAEATALLSTAQTAYQALKAGRVQQGETVLVHGAAGAIGHLAVQLAKILGAGQVIATASAADKLDLARSLGADVGVNYRDEDWSDQVLTATGGRGVDVVLETVGGEVLLRSVRLLAPLGRLVSYGMAGGGEVASIPGLDFIGRTVTGLSLWAVMSGRPDEFAADSSQLGEYFGSGRLRTVVHSRLPLSAAADAHRLMEARAQLGRVVLVP